MLDASSERGLGGETFIPSSGSRRRLVFLSRTQTLTNFEGATNNGAFPPVLARIHHAHMALGPPETRRTCAGAGERHEPELSFLEEEEAARLWSDQLLLHLAI